MRAMIACALLLTLVAGCGGGASRQGDGATAAPAAAPAPKAPRELAGGAAVTVSSTHQGQPGEGPATALTDNDPLTRWSSDYAEPQSVVLDLGAVHALDTLGLAWEAAAATRYRVSLSSDGVAWSQVAEKTGDAPAPRNDEVVLGGAQARYLKLDLLARVNPKWGFSLYGISVIGR